jgi:hypothetical protein
VTRQKSEIEPEEAGERTGKVHGEPPNSAHCSETEWNVKLIYGEAIATMARLDGIQAKFVRAVNVAADELRFIGDREGTLKRSRLERANENEGALGEHVFQGDVFTGEVVPGEFGFFDEEDFILVPAGDFHAATAGNRKRFREHQCSSRKRKSSFSAKEREGKRKQGKQLGGIRKNQCASEKQNGAPVVQSEAERGRSSARLRKRCGTPHIARWGKYAGR